MKVRTAVLWWLVNDKEHETLKLKQKERTMGALKPLVSALFPGINYYSILGFNQVMRDCVIPALKKRYPELLTTPAEKIKPKAMTEIATVLPSKGYEWQNSIWKYEFEEILERCSSLPHQGLPARNREWSPLLFIFTSKPKKR